MVQPAVGSLSLPTSLVGADELKRSLIALLLAATVLVSPGSATVYLLLVTPDAVVVGTDSRSTNVSRNTSDKSSLQTLGNVEKVVPVAGGHILIGTIGLSRLEREGQVIYDFPKWVRSLRVSTETPLIDVAKVVAAESFGVMNHALSMGEHFPKQPDQNPDRLVGYYVAKCDPTGCAAVTVYIEIDRQNQILKPPSMELKTPDRNSYFSFFYSSTPKGIINRFIQGDPPTKQFLLQQYSNEINLVLRNQVLTSQELLDLEKLLLSHEVSEHPSQFGPPVVVYSLTRSSTAKRHEY
jgi:hypothetical protein